MSTNVLLLGLLFAALPARATEEPKPVFPYPVRSHTLPNGLVVHVVPMPSEGVVATYVWMEVGSRDEVHEGRTGFAHFFEHLMFYGTPTLGREARELELVRLGADENAWTWFDETVYHAVHASDRLPRYLEIQADLFQHLALAPEDVRREAGAVYGEFRKGQSSPDSRLAETLYATAFTKHTYRHDTIGYEADIEAMPTAFDYSQSFFAQYYRPENATILVVGDAEPEAVFALVEQHWGSWKAGTEPRPVIATEPVQAGLREAHVDWPTPTAPRLALGWHVPAASDAPEVAALELAGQLLMSPVGSLHRRLVEEEAIAYDLGGGRDDFVDPGLFSVVVTLKEPEHLARAEQIVREELEKLKQGVDPQVLATTRSNARYGFLSSLDDPDRVASALGWAIRRGGDPSAIDRFYAVYDAVTPADVSAATAKWLVDDNLTRVTLTAKEAE